MKNERFCQTAFIENDDSLSNVPMHTDALMKNGSTTAWSMFYLGPHKWGHESNKKFVVKT